MTVKDRFLRYIQVETTSVEGAGVCPSSPNQWTLARMLVEEEEIVKIAKLRAAEVTSNTEQKCTELRKVANDYVDDTMRRTEEAIMAALEEVRRSRSSFRSAAGTVSSAAQTAPAAAPARAPQNIEVMSTTDFDDE